MLFGIKRADTFASFTTPYMRSLLSVLGLVVSHVAFAQITIGPADMPSAGDTMRYRTTVATGVGLQLTGPNVVWDMSNLNIGIEGADTAVTVSSTPLLYQFFFNNGILYPQHLANYAMKGTEFGFQGVSLEDVYDYYKKDATGFRNVGFGANVNGIPASVRRIPVDYIHRFPMNFGDQDTSYSAFNVNIPTLGYFGQTQNRYNTVDGWGTLYLPADTFEVLRVRSVLVKRDTLFVDQFGFGFGFNEPQTVEYKWIAAGMDAPVLTVTTVGGVATTARFHYDPELSVSVLEAGQQDLAPELFPNPANSEVSIRVPTGHDGHLRIMDASGRDVMAPVLVRQGTLVRIATNALPAGSYLVQLVGEGAAWSTRLVVSH